MQRETNNGGGWFHRFESGRERLLMLAGVLALVVTAGVVALL